MSARRPAKVARGTACAGCGAFFINHGAHRRSGKCAWLSAPEEDELPPPLTLNDSFDDELQDLIDISAPDVPHALASLRYEHGFQRPDVEAAKGYAHVVGKRARELTYERLQHLLQPGVNKAEVEAALQAAADKAVEGVATAKQEAAYLRRTLPTLDVRTTELGDGHRIASISVVDATIRLLQARATTTTPRPPPRTHPARTSTPPPSP